MKFIYLFIPIKFSIRKEQGGKNVDMYKHLGLIKTTRYNKVNLKERSKKKGSQLCKEDNEITQIATDKKKFGLLKRRDWKTSKTSAFERIG